MTADDPDSYVLRPIGVVRSSLRPAADAPQQAFEGAPEALLELDPRLPRRFTASRWETS